jgi:hypothetical protein
MKMLLLILFVACQGCAKDAQLVWTNEPYLKSTNIVVEIWSSSDLNNWSLKDTVPASQTNYIISCNLPQEFFKIRNKDINNGFTSYWSN